MPEFDSTVEYRIVQCYGNDAYCVGNDGTVWSRHGRGNSRSFAAWRLLSPGDEGGKLFVNLSDGEGGHKNFGVHTLVAFVGPKPKGLQCRHLNGNYKNNFVDNLCWGTAKENAADKERHGTLLRGSQLKQAAFDDQKVAEIIKRLSEGKSRASIAREFSVDPSAITKIALKKTWRHIPRDIIKGRILVAEDIPIIRSRVAMGETHKTVANDYGIAGITVGAICKRRIWKSA